MRATVDSPKAKSVQFQVTSDASTGGSPGGLWPVTDTTDLVDTTAAGGTRDATGDGPRLVTADLETSGTQKYAFALFRSPRDFDGTNTAGLESRSVQFLATALD